MPDIYISPTGSGNKSGSSADNAMSILSIDKAVSMAGPGGNVLLLADKGDYTNWQTLNITHGGTDGAPVTITGISSTGQPMAAHFVGTRSPVYSAGEDAGNDLFRLGAGANHLVLENMQIDNTGTAIRAAADISDITVRDMTSNNVQRFFEDNTYNSKTTATISGLTIENINVTGFSKGLIRLQYDTHDVVINDVHGDVAGQTGDFFVTGVHFDDTVHNVVVSNSSIANAQNYDGEYWNGDAFGTERGVYNVVYQNTVATGSTDAGYDLKSTATTLINTYSADNAKNYKLWGTITLIDPVGVDPHSRGGTNGQVQIQALAGAQVTVVGGNFADSGSGTYAFTPDGSITFSGTTVQMADDAHLTNKKGLTSLTGVSVTYVDGTGDHSTGTDLHPGSAPDGDAPSTPTTDPVGTTPTQDTPPATDPAPSGDTPATDTPTHTDPAPPADPTPPAGNQQPANDTPQAPASDPTPTPGDTAPVFARNAVQIGNEATDSHTTGQDVFKVDTAAHTVTTKLDGFDANDLLITSTAFNDSNKDGIINAGGNHMFNESDGGIVALGKVTSIRYLGELDGGHAYGALSVRPTGAIEGTFANDVLKGDLSNKKGDTFFFDTNLNYALGSDVIQRFGANDKIVTTTALAADSNGVVHADNGAFALHGNGLSDNVSVFATDGHAVDALVLVGHTITNGVDYYAYAAAPLL